MGGSLSTRYEIDGNGVILVHCKLSGLDAALPEIPRIGFTIRMPEQYDRVTWYGRGPQENYWDRHTAAFVGRYDAKVEELYTPYVRPQENGYRTDVRWVRFSDENGRGMEMAGLPLVCFSAHFNTVDDFDAGETRTGHLFDVKRRPNVYINLDYKQMGVGGNDSWGARPLPQYMLPAGEYEYSWIIRPVPGP